MTMGTNAPHSSEAEAQVNTPYAVTMYDRNGHSVQVMSDDEPYWVNMGFSRVRKDPSLLLDELLLAMEQFQSNARAYVDGVLADGKIDHSDEGSKVAAEVAMREVEQRWWELQTSIGNNYPNNEPEGVALIAPDWEDGVPPFANAPQPGSKVMVDPTQRDLHLKMGYKEADDAG